MVLILVASKMCILSCGFPHSGLCVYTILFAFHITEIKISGLLIVPHVVFHATKDFSFFKSLLSLHWDPREEKMQLYVPKNKATGEPP